jgi:hypothetical protein
MNNNPTADTLSRYVQIDKWIFEVKSVRAIRVDDFGKPYSAIANFALNGNSAYIDGLLTREDDDFTREDYQTFVKMSQQLGLEDVNFDRFKQQRRVSDRVKVPVVNNTKPELTLVTA